ncbi:hypothetical protein [Desulfosporosinus sp. SB140]|uniref:hypothetical protein n=1 Tax=Desulfosporosinus paludis TaxID=3115649 RepID=UPI00388E92AC
MAKKCCTSNFVSLRTASICRKTPVILISALSEEVVKGMKMIPASSLEEAWNLTAQILERQPESVYVMPHGGNTFPIAQSLKFQVFTTIKKHPLFTVKVK